MVIIQSLTVLSMITTIILVESIIIMKGFLLYVNPPPLRKMDKNNWKNTTNSTPQVVKGRWFCFTHLRSAFILCLSSPALLSYVLNNAVISTIPNAITAVPNNMTAALSHRDL